jgi:hypothetical protein
MTVEYYMNRGRFWEFAGSAKGEPSAKLLMLSEAPLNSKSPHASITAK